MVFINKLVRTRRTLELYLCEIRRNKVMEDAEVDRKEIRAMVDRRLSASLVRLILQLLYPPPSPRALQLFSVIVLSYFLLILSQCICGRPPSHFACWLQQPCPAPPPQLGALLMPPWPFNQKVLVSMEVLRKSMYSDSSRGYMKLINVFKLDLLHPSRSPSPSPFSVPIPYASP